MQTFVYVFLTYTVQDARTVLYLGLYISMDSLTLTLASFSQRYLAIAQDNINVLLEQMKVYDNQKIKVFVFICIGVQYLGIFCSVLFGFRKYNKINYIAHPLRIPGISVTSTPDTLFFQILEHKPHKTDASFGSSNVSQWR